MLIRTNLVSRHVQPPVAAAIVRAVLLGADQILGTGWTHDPSTALSAGDLICQLGLSPVITVGIQGREPAEIMLALGLPESPLETQEEYILSVEFGESSTPPEKP
jgi:hypothetical protein